MLEHPEWKGRLLDSFVLVAERPEPIFAPLALLVLCLTLVAWNLEVVMDARRSPSLHPACMRSDATAIRTPLPVTFHGELDRLRFHDWRELTLVERHGTLQEAITVTALTRLLTVEPREDDRD